MALKRRGQEKVLSFIETSKLSNVIEKGHFIFDKGIMYCVRESCEGCKYKSNCKHTKENKLEESLNKSTRNNIKFGTIKNKTDWYLPIIKKEEDLDYVDRVNGRYIPIIELHKLPKDIKARLVLAESFTNLHKKVSGIKGIDLKTLGDYILYNPEESSYYCLKSSCYSCEHKSICQREIQELERDMVYVAVDSASQEPEIVTYLSKEPQYVQIFINHSLTDIDYLLEPINDLFETAYDIDTVKDIKYHTFIDWLAFEDKTILYNFGATYYENIKQTDLEALRIAVKIIDDKYNEFKNLLKTGKIKILEDIKI